MVSAPSNEILERVRSCIAAHQAIPLARIHANSRLVEDLRVDGDDLVELIDHLFASFEIAPNEFDYREFVSPEGLSLFSLRRGSATPDQPSHRALTVAMIAHAAVAHAWSRGL